MARGDDRCCGADTFLTLNKEVGGDDNPVGNGGQISNSRITGVKPRYIAMAHKNNWDMSMLDSEIKVKHSPYTELDTLSSS